MAESAIDLYNLAKQQLADKNANNPFYAFSGGFQKGIDQQQENQNKIAQLKMANEIELQQSQTKFQQQRKQLDIMNATKKTNQPAVNTEYGRASRNVANPTYAGTKEIKAPNSLMRMLSGQEGMPTFTQGNDTYSNTANVFGGQGVTAPETMTQDLYKSASDKAGMDGLSFSNPQQEASTYTNEDNPYKYDPSTGKNVENDYPRKLAEEVSKSGGDAYVKGTTKIKSIYDLNQEMTRIKNKGETPSMTRLKNNDYFNRANVLRDDFDKQAKDYRLVRDSYSRIEASAKDPSAAGDLALIFNYMKTLDPGSTVREGEFATAQNSGSLPDRLVAKYNSIKNGERLAPEQRADFLDRARKLYKSQADIQSKTINQYTERANRYGIEPKDVITDLMDIKDGGNVFSTEQEAEAANLPDGTKIVINGVSGTWRN